MPVTDLLRAGTQAATRLADSKSWWKHLPNAGQPSDVNVFRIAMTYTARFDPKGQGEIKPHNQFGFDRLTWGSRVAEILPDMRAQVWVSSNPPQCSPWRRDSPPMILA